MNRSEKITGAIKRTLKAGLLWWAVVGLIIWSFLAWPYLHDAIGCVSDHSSNGVGPTAVCLQPVADKLRKDSIVATYATATVAAAIALQLSQRRNSGRTDGEGGH